MLFQTGKTYTRYQIHAVLGGEIQTYLPQRGGRIVCGCFKPSLDPAAPFEILVGDGPKVKEKAELLAQQGGTIPVFLQVNSRRWEYKGHFQVKKYSVDPAEIRHKQQETGREYIAAVLYLELVSVELGSTVQKKLPSSWFELPYGHQSLVVRH